MDMSQYIEIFIEETREHLQNLNQSLLQLEKNPKDTVILNEIFRVAHTLKGMAGTMGFTKMTTLTHDMEDVLQAIRNGEIKVSTKLADILFKCLDILETYLNSIVSTGSEGDLSNEEILQVFKKIIETKTTDIDIEEKEKEAPQPIQVNASADNKDTSIFETNIYEQNIINKALDMNINAYKITVIVDKGCILKSARAFIVFQTLEKYCEIIKSVPHVEDIEDEKFDLEFTVVVVSKESQEFLQKELDSIAEVNKVLITPMGKKAVEESKLTDINEAVPRMRADLNLSAQTLTKQEDIGKKPVENLTKYDLEIPDKEIETAKTAAQASKSSKTGKTVRVDIDRLDSLMNLVGELIIVKTRLEGIEGVQRTQNYNEAVEYLERITTSLHDAVMKVRMVPVEMVFNRFPRMVRDLSRETGKEIELIMSGEETELDRTVIDEIGDPLIHLLRNSIDHGIESPEKRKEAGKEAKGTVNLRAYQEGNNVVIEVEDDGGGINIEKVKKKAVETGQITKEAVNALSRKDVIDFLFKPSFSTADKVTDISGRGVGLDVVKTKIEGLGGLIEVDTEFGKGSKFIIRLPLTLAIIQALLVMIGEEKFAIPLSSITEIIDIDKKDIKQVQKQEVIILRKNVIPIVRLDKALDVPKAESESSQQVTVVVVRKGEKLSGFVVDNLIGQQEIVIKSLGRILVGIKSIAGATILGDGQVALIIDVNSLA